MDESILTSIKKLLGIMEDDTSFDMDIIIHINSAFSTLTQLGVGPSTGFKINNSFTSWSSFIKDDKLRLEMIKTYVYLKVRLIFDPPTNSSVIESINRNISELEWRINNVVDYQSNSE